MKSLLENRPAEVQVVLLICTLGAVRILFSLIFDFLRPVILAQEIIVDACILIVFISLLLIAKRRLSFKRVHPVFGIIFALLLCINFLEFGGIEGTNSFNYYAGIYVIVMLFSGRTLYGLISFQLGLLLIMMYLVYIKHPVYTSLLIGIDYEGKIEFIFSVITIAAFTFYLKQVTVSEIEKHQFQINELNTKVNQSKSLNERLVAQSHQLKIAQQELNEEVARRVFILETRKESIEQYIHHNTTTLKEPLASLSLAVEQVNGNSQLHTLLKLSNAELNQMVNSINNALQSEDELNRKTLEKNHDQAHH